MRHPRTRWLIGLAWFVGLGSAGYIAGLLPMPRTITLNPVGIRESFPIPSEHLGDMRPIALKWHSGKWYERDGHVIGDVPRLYAQILATYRQKHPHAYPPIYDLPVYISVGPDASFRKVAEALSALREDGICVVVVEDWFITIHSPTNPPHHEVPAFDLCDA